MALLLIFSCTHMYTVNMLPIGFGMVAGWASPSIILLTSDDSPLVGGKITMEEASSVASFVPLGIHMAKKRISHSNFSKFLSLSGALFGNFLFGFITNKCGRKKILILLAIPAIVCFTHSIVWAYFRMEYWKFWVFLDFMDANFVCPKCFIFVCFAAVKWHRWQWNFYNRSVIFIRNIRYQVRNS